MPAIIGTWDFCERGVRQAYDMMLAGANAGDAAVHAVMDVEDNPEWSSIGYGGLPDETGHVRLDSAYMDGNILRYGAVMSVEGIRNPVLAARLLCGRTKNNLLAADGAFRFAVENGLEQRNMLTDAAKARWEKAVAERQAASGHDTVCILTLDKDGSMVAANSTSGLFMKAVGRVGDTPIIGSGFYCDTRFGAAAATGLGEDIMRGCLSYEIVSRMKAGINPKAACEGALSEYVRYAVSLGGEFGDISVIALSPNGEFGAATNAKEFPYAAGNSNPVALYTATSCC